MVACTAYQNPARLARLVDTIDEISGGRLIAGLGAGDHWSEFQRFGVPDRASCRPVRGGAADHRAAAARGSRRLRGRVLRRPRLRALAAGSRSGPPILIGALGSGPRMVRLVATWADLWNGWYSFADEPAAAPARDPDGARLGSMPRARSRPGIARAHGGRVGGAARLRGIGRLARAARTSRSRTSCSAIGATGVSHVQVVPSPAGPAGVEGMARVLEHLDRAAAPA